MTRLDRCGNLDIINSDWITCRSLAPGPFPSLLLREAWKLAEVLTSDDFLGTRPHLVKTTNKLCKNVISSFPGAAPWSCAWGVSCASCAELFELRFFPNESYSSWVLWWVIIKCLFWIWTCRIPWLDVLWPIQQAVRVVSMTNTKAITQANHKRQRQHSEAIKIQSHYM